MTDLVAAAAAFKIGHASVDELLVTLRAATLYAQRPERPGLFVADLGARGRWSLVFSTLDRLGRHSGACDYLVAAGADVLDDLLPRGVGLIVDADDDHAVALVPAWLSPQPPSDPVAG